MPFRSFDHLGWQDRPGYPRRRRAPRLLPAALQIASPSPLPPPVTRATFPSSDCICCSPSFLFACLGSRRQRRRSRHSELVRTGTAAGRAGDLLIKTEQFLHHDLPGEQLVHPFDGVLSHLLASARWIRKAADSASATASGSRGGTRRPVTAVLDRKLDAAHVRADHRRSAGHGFERRDAEGFVPRRGDEDVGRAEIIFDLVPARAAREQHLVGNAFVPGQLLQPCRSRGPAAGSGPASRRRRWRGRRCASLFRETGQSRDITVSMPLRGTMRPSCSTSGDVLRRSRAALRAVALVHGEDLPAGRSRRERCRSCRPPPGRSRSGPPGPGGIPR